MSYSPAGLARRLAVFVLMLAPFFAAVAGSSKAYGYSPEDPKVIEMVDRGVKYLEGLSEADIQKAQWGGASGQVILVAFAYLKATHEDGSPLVQMGLKHAQAFVAQTRANKGKLQHSSKTTYEVAVAIFFFAELDPNKYAEELKLLGDALFDIQMSHGGYGYPGEPNGDVSQVQYIVLAMWTLDRAHIPIPLDRAKRMLGWLMRVQDVSGSWPYKGIDPGKGGLITQPRVEMSVSTSLAGGSSVLIASDLFRIWGQSTSAGTGIEGLPKAIKKFEKASVVDERVKMAPFPKDAILASTNRMNNYVRQNPAKRTNGADWYYYMMYTLERYQSFLELALGMPTDPGWYDQGVTELMSFQDASGGWGIKDKSWNEPSACTAFAILFLIRSSKKSIGLPSSGSLAGGYLIPKDTTKIVVNGTQIVGEPTSTSVNDLLDLLESDESNSTDKSSIPEDLKLEKDPVKRRAQLTRLEGVIRGSRSWQARRVAAKVLGASDELSVVPALIYALSDPDGPTRRSALDGLNFISRKFEASGFPAEPDQAQIKAQQKKWIAWYSSIYPSYVFLD